MAKKKATKTRSARTARSKPFNSTKNITRIENVSSSGRLSCGWEVRMQRKGKTIEKFFSDTKFGGNRKALSAAKQFRDELNSKLKSYTVKELAKRPSVRNSSGIVGVRFENRPTITGGYEYYYPTWIAQWTDENGKRKTRAFSEDKYGKKGAREKAIKARTQGVNKTQRAKNK